MSPRLPSLVLLLRVGTVLQAAVLVPLGLAWLWVPVRELRSALAPSSDPTADLGPWVVPILLGITGLCVVAAAACLVPAVALPLCAGRLTRRGPLRCLVALEAVTWLVPLVRADVPHTAVPGVLAAVLASLGAAVVALAMHPTVRALRIPSPGAATRVPDPHRAPRDPSARRH